MYIKVKFVTSTEARRNFFKLLDRAARGESVVIERGGVPLKIVRATGPKFSKKGLCHPDYSTSLRSAVDQADQWGWEWGPSGNLEPSKGRGGS